MSGNIFGGCIWGRRKGRGHVVGKSQDATSTGPSEVGWNVSNAEVGVPVRHQPPVYCHLSWNFRTSRSLPVSWNDVFLLVLLLMLKSKMILFLNIEIIHAFFRDFKIFRKVKKLKLHHTEVTSKNVLIFGIFPYHRFFEHTLLSPVPWLFSTILFAPSLTCLATCWNPIQSSKPFQSAPPPGSVVNHSGPAPEWNVNSPTSVFLQHCVSYECQFQHFFLFFFVFQFCADGLRVRTKFSLLLVCPLPFRLTHTHTHTHTSSLSTAPKMCLFIAV